YEDYTDRSNLTVEPPSKDMMDDLFDDFERMAAVNKDVMGQIEEEVQKNVNAGAGLLHYVTSEHGEGQDSSETLKNAAQAKDNLASALTKISQALRNNKKLSAAELKELQAEMSKAYETVAKLEQDVEKHLTALGGKTKEFNTYKDLATKKIDGMKAIYDERMNDTVVEMRMKENECDELQKQLNELERAAQRESRRRDSLSPVPAAHSPKADEDSLRKIAVLEEELESMMNKLVNKEQLVTSMAAKNDELAKEVAKVAESAVGVVAKAQHDAELDALRAQLKESQAQVVTLQQRPEVAPSTPRETKAKVKTLGDKVAKLEEQVKSKDGTIATLNKTLNESNKSKGDLGALQQQHEITAKQLADAQEKVSQLQTELTSAAADSSAEAAAAGKIKQLEQKLTESSNANTSLQSTLTTTSSTLATTTTQLSDAQAAVAAEQLKSQSLAQLLDAQQKQLASSQQALSDQKEALDQLLVETSASETDQTAEKAKYLKMLNELNEKMAALTNREGALGEKEILLNTQQAELEQKGTVLNDKLTTLETLERDLTNQQEELEEKALSVEQGIKDVADKQALFAEESAKVSTVPATEMAEFTKFKDKIAEHGSLAELLTDLQKKRDDLTKLETEVQLKEGELKHRQSEFDEGSVRVSSLEEQLGVLREELGGEEADQAVKREELEARGAEIKMKMEEVERDEKRLEEMRAKILSLRGELDREEEELKADVSERESEREGRAVDAEGEKLQEVVATLEASVRMADETIEGLQKELDEARRETEEALAAPAPGGGDKSRPTTTKDALRNQVADYETQLQSVLDLRTQLEADVEAMEEREAALEKKRLEVEAWSEKELERIRLLGEAAKEKGKGGGEVGGVTIDWYSTPGEKSPEQYECFLNMISNWVAGQRAASYSGKQAGHVQEAGDGRTASVVLTSETLSPLHAIFELHKNQLEPSLRRKFQHIITSALGFNGIITPSSTRADLAALLDQSLTRAKAHKSLGEEIEVMIVESEKQIGNQAKKSGDGVVLNWSTLRKMLSMYADKLEKLGEMGGYQAGMEDLTMEVSKLVDGFAAASQSVLGAEKLDQLDIVGLRQKCESLGQTISASAMHYSTLLTKSQSINELVSILSTEYERVNARNAGNSMEASFAVQFSDAFVAPDEAADPEEIARLQRTIDDMQFELENLKSGQ
ncbi:hypothetical protein TeGR_g12661, partial [Tetraparma gracilis]